MASFRSEGPGAALSHSGASHGGEGGAETSSQVVPQAYGSLTTPYMFGSGGGASSLASGGGILSVQVAGELRVEGQIAADGMDSSVSGTTECGGSKWR